MAPDDQSPPDSSNPTNPSTKACPYCGETIKAVAIRCKHCQADLSADRAPLADFSRGQAQSGDRSGSDRDADFERRFLDFAYETQERLTAISVAHALKLPIAYCDARLESLAAGDTIRREVDDEGNVYFELPGAPGSQSGGQAGPRPGVNALVPTSPGAVVHVGHISSGDTRLGPPRSTGPVPTEAQAVAGLVLNLCIPGAGSIVAGKPGPGVAQLAMVIAGLPLCFVIVGFPIVFAAWLWALMTGVQAMQEAKGLGT
jgi:TM2 domain-containing membrane protein YozV